MVKGKMCAITASYKTGRTAYYLLSSETMTMHEELAFPIWFCHFLAQWTDPFKKSPLGESVFLRSA